VVERDAAVTNADRTIVDIAKKIRLFYHMAPVNEASERARFLEGRRRDGQPVFDYRPLEFATAEARRELEEVPVEAIEDKALRGLYEEKRWELDRLVGLLEARGNEHFLERSVELFGQPSAQMVREAQDLLVGTQWQENRDLDAERVRGMLEEHLESYRRRYPAFDCEVVIDGAMSAKMYVHQNRIHLKRGARFSFEAARCDTVHEIDAHVLTYLNGRRQPLRLFEIGPRGTLAYQESLGVFTEIANGVMFPGRMIALAARVVAVAAMVDDATFGDVFDQLTAEYGLDEEEAFLICVRVFRGGGFTKDWLYVAQLERIFRHWASGCDMEDLLLAKVTMDTLDDIRDLVAQGILRPAHLFPEYLDRISNSRSNRSIQGLLKNVRVPLGDLLSLDLG